MKTGAVGILAALFLTGGAFAIANKACKTGQHPWCIRTLYAKSGKALTGGGPTRARMRNSAHPGSATVSSSLRAAKL